MLGPELNEGVGKEHLIPSEHPKWSIGDHVEINNPNSKFDGFMGIIVKVNADVYRIACPDVTHDGLYKPGEEQWGYTWISGAQLSKFDNVELCKDRIPPELR